MPQQRVVLVDVDNTLIRSAESKRIPIPHVIKKVRELSSEGCNLVCWSSGGATYAEEVAIELGIGACFSTYLPKPHLMIDDQSPEEWRYLELLHPNLIS